MCLKFNLNCFLLLWAFSGQSRQFFNTGFIRITNATPKSATVPEQQFHSVSNDVPNDIIENFEKTEASHFSRATNILPSYHPTRMRLPQLKYSTTNLPGVYDTNGQKSVLTTRGKILWKKCMNGIKKAVKSIYNFSPLEYLNKKLGMDKGISSDFVDFIIVKSKNLKTMDTLDKNFYFDWKNNKVDKSSKKDKTTHIGQSEEKRYKHINYSSPPNINKSNEKIKKENKMIVYNKNNLKNSSENDKIKDKRENKTNNIIKDSKITRDKDDKNIGKIDKNDEYDRNNDGKSPKNSWEESTEQNIGKNDNSDNRFNNNVLNDKDSNKNRNKDDKNKYKKISDYSISDDSSWKESAEEIINKGNGNKNKVNNDNNDEKNSKKFSNIYGENNQENNKKNYKDDGDDNVSNFDSWEENIKKSVGKNVNHDTKGTKEEKDNNKEGQPKMNDNENHGQYKKNNENDDSKKEPEEKDSSDESTEGIEDYDSEGDGSPEIGMENDDENSNESSKKSALNLSQKEINKEGRNRGNKGGFSDIEDNDFDSADSSDVKY